MRCDRCRGSRPSARGPRRDGRRAGHPAWTRLILVVRGRIRSVCRAPNGREISVEVFRTGDLIADFALAGDVPLGNDWEAVESSTLLMIPREALMAFLRGTPDVLVALAAGLCGPARAFEAAGHRNRALGCSGAGRLPAGGSGTPGRAGPARGSADPQPADPARAGQSDRCLPRNRVPNGLRARPAGAADAARAVAPGQQAPGRRQRLTLRSRVLSSPS